MQRSGSAPQPSMEHDVLFQTVGVKAKLVDQVVARLQSLIIDGQLEPGMRLPPERELADRIGVSRTVLREAVRILVTKGLLETRHGVGTLVRQVNSDQFMEPLNWLMQTSDLSIEQMHQVRLILEVGIVRLAAQKVEPEDLAELQRLLADMELAANDREHFAMLDDAFHSALAHATHNPLLVVLAESIGTIMHEVRTQVHGAAVLPVSVLAAAVLPDHRRILAALAAHDAGAAAAAMQAHLGNALRFQQEYLALVES